MEEFYRMEKCYMREGREFKIECASRDNPTTVLVCPRLDGHNRWGEKVGVTWSDGEYVVHHASYFFSQPPRYQFFADALDRACVTALDLNTVSGNFREMVSSLPNVKYTREIEDEEDSDVEVVDLSGQG